MRQAVELQGIVIGVGDHDGLARVGFSFFHSEDPGAGARRLRLRRVLRERPVLVGTWDELMDMERPEVGDFGDDDEVEDD